MPREFPYAVEAVAFFACACQYSFDTVQYQFIYQAVSENLNFTKNKSVEYCSPNTTSSAEEQAVADDVSRWTLYSMLSGYITCFVGATVFTSWSDKIGRKAAITFPVVGTLVAATMQCIVIAYRLPLYSLIITELVYGASGSYSALINIGSAYLSDNIRPEERGRRFFPTSQKFPSTTRYISAYLDNFLHYAQLLTRVVSVVTQVKFTILEVAASVGGGLVQIGTGYWIERSGFVPTSIFIACCAVVSLSLIPFMASTKNVADELSETRPLLRDESNDDGSYVATANTTGDSQMNPFILLKQLKHSWEIYARKRCVCENCIEDGRDEALRCQEIKKGRRWRLWFYAMSFAIYMFALNGVSMFTTMFLVSYPVCFTPDLVGAQAGLTNGLIIVVPGFLWLFQGVFNFGGQAIIILGVFTRICSSALMSFATGPVLVFTATSLAVVYNLTTSFIRSEASQLVSVDEQGAVLAMVSALENLASIFGPLVFLTLYPSTLHIFHGFSLIVAAMLYAVVFVMMTAVWMANRRKVSISKDDT